MTNCQLSDPEFPSRHVYTGALATQHMGWWRRTRIMETDFQSLALFRILFAFFLIVDFFVNVAPYYSIFFTDHGILPRSLLMHDGWATPANFSLLVLNDYPAFHVAFCAVHIAALFAFLTGYRTRVANLVLLVTYASLYFRNPLLLSNCELLSKLFLLWTVFAPMNRYWSVDSALDPLPRDRSYPKIPVMGIKLQIVTIYLFAALFKIGGASWILDGSALTKALSDNWYGGTEYGLYIAAHISPIMGYFACYLATIFQLFFSALVYSPIYNDSTRALAIAGAFLMHTSFLILLNIGIFPIICWVYLVLLVPDTWWNAILRSRRERLSKIRMFYDPDCGFCQKVALILREFCLPVTVPVMPASADTEALRLLRQHNSWVVYDENGIVRLHWDAVAYVLKKSPCLFWLGWATDVCFLRPLMRKLYDKIGSNRPALGAFAQQYLPFKEQPAPGTLVCGFCAFLMTLSFLNSVYTIPRPAFDNKAMQKIFDILHVDTPKWLYRMALFFQVEQEWGLFAPDPSQLQRYVKITGIYSNGDTVNLWNLWPLHPMTIAANGYGARFVSHRWLKYFSRLGFQDGERRRALAHYLCKTINADTNSVAEQIRFVKVSNYWIHYTLKFDETTEPKNEEIVSCM